MLPRETRAYAKIAADSLAFRAIGLSCNGVALAATVRGGA